MCEGSGECRDCGGTGKRAETTKEEAPKENNAGKPTFWSSLKNKAKASFKKLGKSGAKAAATGATAGVVAAKAGGRRFKDFMDTPVAGMHPVGFFLVVWLVFHLAFALWLPSNMFTYVTYGVLFFIVLPLIMPVFIADGSTFKDRMLDSTYVTLSIIQIAVLFIVKSGAALFPIIQPFLSLSLVSLFFFFNAWGIYVIFQYGNESKLLKILRFLIIALAIILMLMQIYAFMTPLGFNIGGTNYGMVTMKQVYDGVIKGVKGVWLSIPLAYNGIRNDINKSIAVATGTYYEGEIEQNKGEPLGVFINNVRPIDKILLSGPDQTVTILADLSGQSFKRTIVVQTRCVARDGSGKFYTPDLANGGMDPVEPFRIEYKGAETLFCNFKNLPAGHYEVQVQASFPFETWSYIPYTFVSQDTYRNFYAQGRDINTELSVERRPVAVYTAGPVMVGLSSEDQPIPLDITTMNSGQAGSLPAKTFGATIENRWPEGVIERVNYFVLKVPVPFFFTQCYPGCSQTQTAGATQCDPEDSRLHLGSIAPDADGYRSYVFKNVDPRAEFTTVTCRMSLSAQDPQSQALLLGKVKAQKTFVAQVNYTYTLTKTLGIDVK